MTPTPQSYPAYKPSGVSWLGDVPAYWELVPSRAVFTEVNERDHPDEQMLSVTIARGVIRQQRLLQDSSQKDGSRLDKSAYKLVCLVTWHTTRCERGRGPLVSRRIAELSARLTSCSDLAMELTRAISTTC